MRSVETRWYGVSVPRDNEHVLKRLRFFQGEATLLQEPLPGDGPYMTWVRQRSLFRSVVEGVGLHLVALCEAHPKFGVALSPQHVTYRNALGAKAAESFERESLRSQPPETEGLLVKLRDLTRGLVLGEDPFLTLAEGWHRVVAPVRHQGMTYYTVGDGAYAPADALARELFLVDGYNYTSTFDMEGVTGLKVRPELRPEHVALAKERYGVVVTEVSRDDA